MKQWTVRDVMTSEVVTARPHTPYHDLVELLAEYRVSALPVVDDDNAVLGMASEADLLRKIEFAGDASQPRFFDWGSRRAAHEKAAAANAGELMTEPPVTVTPETALTTAAKLMDHKHVKRLPVVEDGHLVGIVSRSDLLKTYLRTDAEIYHDVMQGVVEQLLRRQPTTVSVEVDHGVAHLSGRLERRSTAEAIAAITRAIPGVVQVTSELTWEQDDTYVMYPTGL